MSSTEQNKDVVRAFCRNYSNGDWDEIGNLLAETFRWKAMTSQRRQAPQLVAAPILNESPGYTKVETLEIFRQTVVNCVDHRFDLTPVSLVAEGDRVAAECKGFAVNKANGRVYDNRYHHLFVLDREKILELREYQDTLLLYDVWMAP